jgi:LuxR family maltose regulon positive regulatory protein
MQETEALIRTKLRLPYTRPELVARPRLQEQIKQGLRGPLTLITAPAGFGKTTLVAACISGSGMPVAWLSLDKNDNQTERFLSYLVAGLEQAEDTIGREAAQLLSAARQAHPEAILTSLVNDLDINGKEIALVLDDYQFINSQAVHEAVSFLLEHCPRTFHLLIASRSDPPLPLARLRARGQTVELRAADLRFTEPEAAQFLNEVMGLRLDAGSVAALEVRTEGWIAGLQMAALSMRDRKDVIEFIEGFSGTNRYILDYLLEEVLAGQSPEMQCFLLCTSILERLSAPLCDAMVNTVDGLTVSTVEPLEVEGKPQAQIQRFNVQTFKRSNETLEYLERANLFLVPLDDERQWYRYHHLFADLLRARLDQIYPGIAPRLHGRAAAWFEQDGSILEAIHHASMASDDEQVERLIEQNYMEMVNRGEMSWTRLWTGELSKELVYRRPWLCIYGAMSHAWFGELDQADQLLDVAEKRIRSENLTPDDYAMQGNLTYVRSRVTAMRGDTRHAIELCLAAREYLPADNLAMQLDTSMTLGYEYFLNGDYAHAGPILQETMRSGTTAGSIINTVAAHCIMARLYAVQGRLHKSYDLYHKAAQLIPEASGQHLGAKALLEAGIAEVQCELNDLEAALAHVEQGLAWMPWWGKADDFVLAYLTLWRIQMARANQAEAKDALEKAIQIVQTSGLFSEARQAVEIAQVKVWLDQGEIQVANRWAASLAGHSGPDGRLGFENELAQITRARVYSAQNKPEEAIALLSHLEATARSAGRLGRVIEILLLKAIALRQAGDSTGSLLALTECLKLAEPEGYVRVFLDEGQPMQAVLAQWLGHEQGQGLAHAGASALRDYAIHLLAHFDAESQLIMAAQAKAFLANKPATSSGRALVASETDSNQALLIEPLSQRELEVLQLIALGRTNQEIAGQLIVAPGTIKAHTASIYRKLDVANRTEAVARARQLGILP